MGRELKRALGLIVALLPLPALAEAVEWRLGAGGELYWFDWREYQGGERLLVESGPLAKANIDLRLQTAALYTSLAFSLGGGKAHYDGQLQDGTPYASDAWESVAEAELQLGWQQPWGNVHLGLLHRGWDRKIDGDTMVSSAHELYRWRLFTLGTELLLIKTPVWTGSLQLDAGLPVDSYQKVYSAQFGNFELEPGDGYFWRLALAMRNGAWEFSPFVQQQTMDVSDPLQLPSRYDGQLYRIVQPASARVEAGLRMLYVFGGGAQANTGTRPEPAPESLSAP